MRVFSQFKGWLFVALFCAHAYAPPSNPPTSSEAASPAPAVTPAASKKAKKEKVPPASALTSEQRVQNLKKYFETVFRTKGWLKNLFYNIRDFKSPVDWNPESFTKAGYNIDEVESALSQIPALEKWIERGNASYIRERDALNEQAGKKLPDLKQRQELPWNMQKAYWEFINSQFDQSHRKRKMPEIKPYADEDAKAAFALDYTPEKWDLDQVANRAYQQWEDTPIPGQEKNVLEGLFEDWKSKRLKVIEDRVKSTYLEILELAAEPGMLYDQKTQRPILKKDLESFDFKIERKDGHWTLQSSLNGEIIEFGSSSKIVLEAIKGYNEKTEGELPAISNPNKFEAVTEAAIRKAQLLNQTAVETYSLLKRTKWNHDPRMVSKGFTQIGSRQLERAKGDSVMVGEGSLKFFGDRLRGLHWGIPERSKSAGAWLMQNEDTPSAGDLWQDTTSVRKRFSPNNITTKEALDGKWGKRFRRRLFGAFLSAALYTAWHEGYLDPAIDFVQAMVDALPEKVKTSYRPTEINEFTPPSVNDNRVVFKAKGKNTPEAIIVGHPDEMKGNLSYAEKVPRVPEEQGDRTRIEAVLPLEVVDGRALIPRVLENQLTGLTLANDETHEMIPVDDYTFLKSKNGMTVIEFKKPVNFVNMEADYEPGDEPRLGQLTILPEWLDAPIKELEEAKEVDIAKSLRELQSNAKKANQNILELQIAEIFKKHDIYTKVRKPGEEDPEVPETNKFRYRTKYQKENGRRCIQCTAAEKNVTVTLNLARPAADGIQSVRGHVLRKNKVNAKGKEGYSEDLSLYTFPGHAQSFQIDADRQIVEVLDATPSDLDSLSQNEPEPPGWWDRMQERWSRRRSAHRAVDHDTVHVDKKVEKQPARKENGKTSEDLKKEAEAAEREAAELEKAGAKAEEIKKAKDVARALREREKEARRAEEAEKKAEAAAKKTAEDARVAEEKRVAAENKNSDAGKAEASQEAEARHEEIKRRNTPMEYAPVNRFPKKALLRSRLGEAAAVPAQRAFVGTPGDQKFYMQFNYDELVEPTAAIADLKKKLLALMEILDPRGKQKNHHLFQTKDIQRFTLPHFQAAARAQNLIERALAKDAPNPYLKEGLLELKEKYRVLIDETIPKLLAGNLTREKRKRYEMIKNETLVERTNDLIDTMLKHNWNPRSRVRVDWVTDPCEASLTLLRNR